MTNVEEVLEDLRNIEKMRSLQLTNMMYEKQDDADILLMQGLLTGVMLAEIILDKGGLTEEQRTEIQKNIDLLETKNAEYEKNLFEDIEKD